jgi:hypothetical protein
MRFLIGAALMLGIGAAGVLATPPHNDQAADIEPAAEHYVVIFAYQGPSNRPRHSHTFATFVRSEEDDSAKGYALETHTISWMPASLNVRPLALFPERGRNLTLDETMKLARSMNARVTAWGPYPIAPELFDKALKRKARLESGAMSYKALDGRFRGGNVTNCVHAVSDIDPSMPLLGSGTIYGEPASAAVVRYFDKWLRPAEQDLAWVMADLKLAPAQLRVAAGPRITPSPVTVVIAEEE